MGTVLLTVGKGGSQHFSKPHEYKHSYIRKISPTNLLLPLKKRLL